jgi:membrane protease YdiL (CAAX protease family)
VEEEVTFRGVLLFGLLHTFRRREAVVASATAFGLIHLLNLTSGRELVWVLGQVGWMFLIGVFYGYLVLKTDSLLPAIVVHYLGNAFVGSLTEYLQMTATVGTQALYGVVFTYGVVPTVVLGLWVRLFASRWLRSTVHPVEGAS